MSDLKIQKDALRKTFLEKRMALKPEVQVELSQSIQDRVIKHTLWKDVESIGLYSAVKNEVDTRLLLMKALEKGCSVYFPRVEQGLKFYEVRDPNDLVKGAWGILEPATDLEPLPVDQTLDLLVLPGLVFDKRGYRLGYGKAFYDAIVKQFFKASLAMAYDFQIIDELPIEPWDQKLHRIFTEKHEYTFEA